MKNKRFSLGPFVILFLLVPYICQAQGLSTVSLERASVQKFNLTVGNSIIVRSSENVCDVVVPQASSETVEAQVLTASQIYLSGKTPGITTVTLWSRKDCKDRLSPGWVTGVLDVEVAPDIARLKEKLARLFPEEKSIKVEATHDSLTLSGSVSSTAVLPQVLGIVEPFFPKKVINLMDVSGTHQVMIEVRVAEMSRGLLRRLGFNFAISGQDGFGVSLLNNLTRATTGGGVTGLSDRVSAIIGNRDGTNWTFFIDALKEDGMLKVLAEPTLVTLSGKQADFLAGGEFPVPVPQVSGGGGQTITIEYKPFGVGLRFAPTVLSSKKINMQIMPEVSELDFSNAVTISGFTVPALTTRRVSTVVELGDGQSFAIAGIIRDQHRSIVSKFPVLGDLPVLGTLFRSTSFQKNETELVVIATPRLVKPLDPDKQTLPTDAYVEPTDAEFYLFGQMEGKGQTSESPSPAVKRRPLEGEDFGHVKPKEGQR